MSLGSAARAIPCEVHFGGRVEEEIVGDRKIYKHVDYTTVLARALRYARAWVTM